ncbi:MAG: type I-C CRISPR-associated protein Cas5 [Deltaproteobacteria bacterium]|nr:MAG: type I-C CRISPR-associated protein Cas5 [Deltaproteobacteria bacterium]
MSYGVKIKAWGERACFTRPEMKVERVSYDVPTPSSVRGILEAIYWKPSIRWVVSKIIVQNPISFENIRRNELGGKLSKSNIIKAMRDGESRVETFIEDNRQQRASMVLKNVSYIFEAFFEMTGLKSEKTDDQNPQKHLEIFTRRAQKGQCFHQAYFGCREFPVNFEWMDNDDTTSPFQGKRDLGWMLYDMYFQNKNDPKPLFYRPKMINGVINVPHYNSEEVIG